ncbi:hypothetical protein Hte_007715 [Hypoxylon texense]
MSRLTNPPYISTSALGCNATLEVVDVIASYIGPNLDLDPSHPPRAIESTSRPIPVDADAKPSSGFSLGFSLGTQITLSSGNLYNISLGYYEVLASLPPRGNKSSFDPFFEQLVTSRYAIPISAIGDPTQTEAVRDAIMFQHRVIAAQYYSQFRVDIGDANGTIFPSLSHASATNDTGMYYGTATDPQGRRRLVQDPTSTRVIEALLLTTMAFSLLGWFLVPRKEILPRSTTSVASTLALLAGGDVLEYLYKDGDTHFRTIEDVKLVFPKDCKFWMGWGPPGITKPRSEQRFGIWMMPQDSESSEV